MCRERPWFTALCGIPLRSWVMDLGILQLGLTLVITSLSVIKYVDTIDTCSGALCLGPVFKVSQNNYSNICSRYGQALGLWLWPSLYLQFWYLSWIGLIHWDLE